MNETISRSCKTAETLCAHGQIENKREQALACEGHFFSCPRYFKRSCPVRRLQLGWELQGRCTLGLELNAGSHVAHVRTSVTAFHKFQRGMVPASDTSRCAASANVMETAPLARQLRQTRAVKKGLRSDERVLAGRSSRP